MRTVALITAVSVLALACGPAQQRGGGAPARGAPAARELSPAERAEVQRIGDLGATIYEQDKVSAIATDILLAQINPADFPNFRGWLARDWGNHYVVSFYEETDGAISLIADITLRPSGEPEVQLRPARELPADELAMFRARQTGLEAGVNNCSDRFNTVVFPLPDGAFDVFVLAATTDPELVVVGGHSRIRVAADGVTVLEREPFSRSCLAIDLTPDDLPPGAEVTAHAVTHIVSPYPAPTHVFLSLLHDTAFYVGTELGVWIVDRGSIGFLGQSD